MSMRAMFLNVEARMALRTRYATTTPVPANTWSGRPIFRLVDKLTASPTAYPRPSPTSSPKRNEELKGISRPQSPPRATPAPRAAATPRSRYTGEIWNVGRRRMFAHSRQRAPTGV